MYDKDILNNLYDRIRFNVSSKLILYQDMQKAWMEHIGWTRSLIISMVDNLKDINVIANRLLDNPGHIANIFNKYYNNSVAASINKVLSDHLTIELQIIKALINNDNNFLELDQRWYENINTIIMALNIYNPNFDQKYLKNIFYKHMDLIKAEIIARIKGNYKEEIAIFDKNVDIVLELADTLSAGIVKQFSLN